MKERRKRVADLKVGDHLKGLGSVERTEPSLSYPHCALVSTRLGVTLLPDDAEVTVYESENRWRMTVTYEAANPEALADYFAPGSTTTTGRGFHEVICVVSEIEEIATTADA